MIGGRKGVRLGVGGACGCGRNDEMILLEA